MLYTKDKSNKVRFWNVSVDEEGDQVFITKRHGVLDGKEVSTRTEIKSGKNIGKNNETTKLRQAQLEAHSLFNKQLDAGYVEDLETLESRILILPMLANKWEYRCHHIKEPFYVQPKLDGVRMLVGRYEGKLIMLSRSGKHIHHLPHIMEELTWLKEGEFVDGENYNGDITFEEIAGICRTTLESSASLKDLHRIQFHVFDTFNLQELKKPFQDRLQYLESIFNSRTFKCIHLVPSKLIESRDLVIGYHSTFVQAGYEGIMIRDRASGYMLAERSNQLLKYKSFHTEEYLIVGAEEARGKDRGTVVWVCETQDGKYTFNVRPKGTHSQRVEWFQNFHKYCHKMLTVQFQNLTASGIPRFPVGMSIRDYE
jgi:DNA ligase-1